MHHLRSEKKIPCLLSNPNAIVNEILFGRGRKICPNYTIEQHAWADSEIRHDLCTLGLNDGHTCTMAAPSGDEGHGEARVDVVHTGELLWRGLGTAPLLVRALVVVHHQLLHLHKALNDGCHPEVHLWDLEHSKEGVRQKQMMLYKAGFWQGHNDTVQITIHRSKHDLNHNTLQ